MFYTYLKYFLSEISRFFWKANQNFEIFLCLYFLFLNFERRKKQNILFFALKTTTWHKRISSCWSLDCCCWRQRYHCCSVMGQLWWVVKLSWPPEMFYISVSVRLVWPLCGGVPGDGEGPVRRGGEGRDTEAHEAGTHYEGNTEWYSFWGDVVLDSFNKAPRDIDFKFL